MNATPRNRASFRSLISGLVVGLALSTPAIAQEKPANGLDFTLDPATTSIHWTLNTNIHTVHGTYRLTNAAVHIEPVTGNASGLIVIDATSGDSGDSARDKRMDSVVLETAKYPTITFRPTHVEGKVDLSADGPITVNGVMNLHGQDHPMQMSVNLHPKNSAVASETHFMVPYVAWGMKDPSVMMFRTEKQVSIEIDATAIHATDSARLR
jgi:polyisoprenoid-binding protein YceI